MCSASKRNHCAFFQFNRSLYLKLDAVISLQNMRLSRTDKFALLCFASSDSMHFSSQQIHSTRSIMGLFHPVFQQRFIQHAGDVWARLCGELPVCFLETSSWRELMEDKNSKSCFKKAKHFTPVARLVS